MIPRIKYLGNIAEQLADIYYNAKKRKYDLIFDWNSLDSDIESSIERELLNISKEAACVTNASFFAHHLATNNASFWHYDGRLDECMVISTYPYNTQIFQQFYELDIKWDPAIIPTKKDAKRRNAYINKLVREGKGRIITPKAGDVYMVEPRTIHRANPESRRCPRVCGRIYFRNKRIKNVFNDANPL